MHKSFKKPESLWLKSHADPVMISLSPRFDDYPHFHESYEQYDFPSGARHAQVPVRWVLTSKLFQPIVIDDYEERQAKIEFINWLKKYMREGHDIPPVLVSKGKIFDGVHRTAAAWELRIKYVPVVDVADLKKAGKLAKAGRKPNPADETTPPQPSGATGWFKLAAGAAVIGLAGAAIWKFFSKDTGSVIVDTKPTPAPAPEKPLVGSKILAKLPAFNPEATGTIPYYVVNVFSSQDEIVRPAPGVVDIATYLRSVPVDDITVLGPYLPAQDQHERFQGPMPTLAVIVAPNGMVITSMNQAELQALAAAQ